MEEPDCPNAWCETEYSTKWSGPGEEGYLIVPFGKETKIPFHPKRVICEDKFDDCYAWSTWDSNECERNRGWMSVNCPKSCGQCKAKNNGKNNNSKDGRMATAADEL